MHYRKETKNSVQLKKLKRIMDDKGTL